MLPVLVFCGCVYLTSQLWQRQMGEVTALGEVASTTTEIKIRPQTIGALVALPRELLPWRKDRPEKLAWEVLDYVKKGDLLMKLDDRPAEKALEAIKSEIAALRAQLAETRERVMVELADRRDEHLDRMNQRAAEARRLTIDIEAKRLDVLDRQTLLEANRIELKRRAEALAMLTKAVRDGVEDEYTLADTKLDHDALAKDIEYQELALTGANAVHKAAEKRLGDYVAMQGEPTASRDLQLAILLDPISKAITTQEVLMAGVQLQIDNLEVRAPVAGQITAIGFRPDETVQAGDLVMTITPTRGDHIISYIPEDRPIEPKEGQSVEIKVRARPAAEIVKTTIAMVGKGIQLMPEHQWRDPRVPQWGRPVKIVLPPKLDLAPGQLVEVSFKQKWPS